MTGKWMISLPYVLVGEGRFCYSRHNELRDLEAELLSMVCRDIETEPVRQHISEEQLSRGSNLAQDVRLDIHARGFWEHQQSAFLDVRVCHPNADSYKDLEPQQIYRRHENEKSVCTQREFLTLSMDHLHLWSSPKLAGWERNA